MKKIIYITAILALAAGCQKEVANHNLENNLQEVTFTTATPAFTMNPETKTHLGTLTNGVISVEWDKNDAIATGKNKILYTLTNTKEAGSEASFTGEIDKEAMKFTKTYHEMALYPASALVTTSGNYFEESDGKATTRNGVTYKTEQVLTPGTFDKTANIAVAIFDVENDTELYFHNLTSLLAFKLQGNAKIKAVEISSPRNGHAIAGVIGIQNYGNNCKGADAKFSFFPSSNKNLKQTITLTAQNPEEGIDITEAKEFYACVMPTAIKPEGSTTEDIYINGLGKENIGLRADYKLNVKFIDIDDNYLVKNITITRNVGAGDIYVLGNWTGVDDGKFPSK